MIAKLNIARFIWQKKNRSSGGPIMRNTCACCTWYKCIYRDSSPRCINAIAIAIALFLFIMISILSARITAAIDRIVTASVVDLVRLRRTDRSRIICGRSRTSKTTRYRGDFSHVALSPDRNKSAISDTWQHFSAQINRKEDVRRK